MVVRKQKGMSLIGFLIVLSMVVCFVYLGMRVVPIYMEFYSVRNAMEGIAAESGSANYSQFVVKDKMLNRLFISYSGGNVGLENIRVVRNNGVFLEVKYEVRRPIIGNLDVIADFNERVQLNNR